MAGGERAGGREAGTGLLQGFMQEMVKPELESRPEDGRGKWAKTLSREENGWGSGTDHVGGGWLDEEHKFLTRCPLTSSCSLTLCRFKHPCGPP